MAVSVQYYHYYSSDLPHEIIDHLLFFIKCLWCTMAGKLECVLLHKHTCYTTYFSKKHLLESSGIFWNVSLSGLFVCSNTWRVPCLFLLIWNRPGPILGHRLPQVHYWTDRSLAVCCQSAQVRKEVCSFPLCLRALRCKESNRYMAVPPRCVNLTSVSFLKGCYTHTTCKACWILWEVNDNSWSQLYCSSSAAVCLCFISTVLFCLPNIFMLLSVLPFFSLSVVGICDSFTAVLLSPWHMSYLMLWWLAQTCIMPIHIILRCIVCWSSSFIQLRLTSLERSCCENVRHWTHGGSHAVSASGSGRWRNAACWGTVIYWCWYFQAVSGLFDFCPAVTFYI